MAELPAGETSNQSPRQVTTCSGGFTHLPCETLLFFLSCRLLPLVRAQCLSSELHTGWGYGPKNPLLSRIRWRPPSGHPTIFREIGQAICLCDAGLNSNTAIFIFTMSQRTTFTLTTSTCKLGTALCTVNSDVNTCPGEEVQVFFLCPSRTKSVKKGFLFKKYNFPYFLKLN